MSHNENANSLQCLDDIGIEEILARAIKKIGGKKDVDVCRYIPAPSGDGYLHHFTLRKMKSKNPDELESLLKKFIFDSQSPKSVPPRPRAARGSRKNRDHISFTRYQLDRILQVVKNHCDDPEVLNILLPKPSPATVKKDFLRSIRNEEVIPELWEQYTKHFEKT